MAAPSVAAEPVRAGAWGRVRSVGLGTWLTLPVLGVGLLLPFLLDDFWISTLVFVLIGAIGGLGLNVLTGYTGQVSLGQAFFLGVGAYTAAVLGQDHGVNALLWIPAAGVVAALLGGLIGPTALRLRGLYLAIVTIGLVFIGQHIFVNLESVSGGSQGRAIPQPAFLGLDFSSDQNSILGIGFNRDGLYYYLSLFILVLAMLFVRNLTRTRTGRALQAVRDREVAASLMGVDLARAKVGAFVISSFLAGVAGALYGAFLTHVDPLQFNLLLSIQYVAIIIVGGVGTIWGALLGAIFIEGLQPVLERYSDSIPLLQHSAGEGGIAVGDATDIIFGVLIVLFLVVEPRGLIGIGARARALAIRTRVARSRQSVSGLEEKA